MSALDDIRRRVANPLHPAHRTRSMSDRAHMLATLDAVLALANKWAALGPADDWAEGGMADTVLADAGRAVRAAVNGALEGK